MTLVLLTKYRYGSQKEIIILNMIYFIDRNNIENIIIQLFLNEIGVKETFTICNIKLTIVLLPKCVFCV